MDFIIWVNCSFKGHSLEISLSDAVDHVQQFAEREHVSLRRLSLSWLSPVLLCLLVNGFSVALALEVQLAVLEPNELEDRDLPRLSELTFLVLLVAVLLQSAAETQ